MVPLEKGDIYGNAITGIKDHADYWEELRADGSLNVLPENLQDEYFSVPRGRVVYHTDKDVFTVFHGNNITKKDLHKIARAFCLPKNKTCFEEDLHYCDLTEDDW